MPRCDLYGNCFPRRTHTCAADLISWRRRKGVRIDRFRRYNLTDAHVMVAYRACDRADHADFGDADVILPSRNRACAGDDDWSRRRNEATRVQSKHRDDFLAMTNRWNTLHELDPAPWSSDRSIHA